MNVCHVSRSMATVAMAFAVVTVSCGPHLGESFKRADTIPPDKALIYIYRQYGGVGFYLPVTIIANGQEIIEIPANGYYTYFADPGEIEFSTKSKTARTESVTIDAKAGQTYFIKMAMYAGAFVPNATLTVMSKERAEVEVVDCRLVRNEK